MAEKRSSDGLYAQGVPKIPRIYHTDNWELGREGTFERVFEEIDKLREIIKEGNSATEAELLQYQIEKNGIDDKFNEAEETSK